MTDKEKIDALVEALEEMVWQHCSSGAGKIYHEHMSANQVAFNCLGLENGMNYKQMKAARKAARGEK